MSPILGIWASGAQPAANAGSFESIATVTVGSGGASSMEFTSIPSTYTHLQIRMLGRKAGSNDNANFQFNSDTGSNYAWHYFAGDGSSVFAGSLANASNSVFAVIPISTDTANCFGGIILDILDYANTNKYKTTRSLSGNDRNGSGGFFMLSGLWRSTSAITSIKINAPTSDFAQYTTAALYGIKSA